MTSARCHNHRLSRNLTPRFERSQVRGRENYELVKKVVEALEIMGMVGAEQLVAMRRRDNEELQQSKQ